MINKEEFYFASRDGKHKLHAMKWIPETEKPVCILQIVHGMTEYIGRYADFALAMAKKGILVVGDDHLGHGLSVPEGEPMGYFCEEDAATVLVRDEHRLKKMMQEQYPGIPYIILGHSMGSFILRNYLMRYGSGIDGAIIMGTGMQPKFMVRLGWIQASLISLLRGSKYVCKGMDRALFGVYNKHFTAGPEDSGHWVSVNIENVKAFRADPLCQFVFTANGFKTLMQLILNLYDEEKLAQMPKDLPVLFVSGQDDPVGDFGKSVEKVFRSFEALGMENVQMRLYPKDRHEILNEADKEQVYGDIYRFILQRIS
ncbi:MAG: alpha/beta hydrolase [Bacteroidales bacterium]|nr:alpha/beta hydrolase [Bacteroidales bacterium]MCM1414957.1 alpha/beta hydrolase [bacterium]MCM1423172.1 alpha/beta hydrolase [bacterium]